MGGWGRAPSWPLDAHKRSRREWKEQPSRSGAAGSGGEAVAGVDWDRQAGMGGGTDRGSGAVPCRALGIATSCPLLPAPPQLPALLRETPGPFLFSPPLQSDPVAPTLRSQQPGFPAGPATSKSHGLQSPVHPLCTSVSPSVKWGQQAFFTGKGRGFREVILVNLLAQGVSVVCTHKQESS